MNMTYAAQVVSQSINPAAYAGGGSSGQRLYFVDANDYSGHRAYYAVLVHPLRLPRFQKEVKAGKVFDLEEYGEIVARGYGELTPELRAQICEEHGVKA